MKLAPYPVFGRLRLRKWYPENEFLEEKDTWHHLINEGVRGISFLRSADYPDETFHINLDLLDFTEDHRFEILEIIGLPLHPGQSPETVKALLGEPESFSRSRRHHASGYIFKSSPPEPYTIACDFDDEKGLRHIAVTRLDIPFPKSEEELNSPPSDHQFLGEYEVLPENITSPESPISKVRLLMESSGNFRYLIHIPAQNGITVESASLTIRDPTKHETSRIPLCLHGINKETGAIELAGWIDKELLFRTFVWISMRDKIHNTHQYVVIEFDQWYGKYVGP
jgi:hypothetical protein